MQSIAKYGLKGTTIKTIAKAARASHGLVQHYYKNKDALLVDAFRHLAARWSDQVSDYVRRSGPAADVRLRAIAVSLFTLPAFKRETIATYVAFSKAAQHSSAILAVNREFNNRYRLTVTRLFSRAANELRVEVEAEDAAIGLLALFDGLWLEYAIDAKIYPPERAIKICHDYINRVLEGRKRKI